MRVLVWNILEVPTEGEEGYEGEEDGGDDAGVCDV